MLVIQPVDIGQQDHRIRLGRLRDTCGQTVVVAKADFMGGDRIVLVHHGDRAGFKQAVQRRRRVEIAAAAFQIL